MNVLQKIKLWWRGQHIPLSLQEMIERTHLRFGEDPPREDLSEMFHRPLIARICNRIGRFWLRHWQWIIGTVIALIGLYLLYLQLIESK